MVDDATVELQVTSPEKLFQIMDETGGTMVIDSLAMFPNKRSYYRVRDESVQVATVRQSSTEEFRVETNTISYEEFLRVVERGETFELWPVSESPFTAVQPDDEEAVFNT